MPHSVRPIALAFSKVTFSRSSFKSFISFSSFSINDLKLLIDNNIPIPKIVLFETLVKYKKNIKLMHTYSINDLIKEVYRNV